MNNFTKGIICGVAITLMGKIVYELGKRKDRKTAEQLEKIVIILTKENKEES